MKPKSQTNNQSAYISIDINYTIGCGLANIAICILILTAKQKVGCTLYLIHVRHGIVKFSYEEIQGGGTVEFIYNLVQSLDDRKSTRHNFSLSSHIFVWLDGITNWDDISMFKNSYSIILCAYAV